eukprot:scaffold9965_cov64-Phaeocystis_antarctica.AAC.5
MTWSNSCATDDRCEREGAIVHGQDLGSAVHHQCLLQEQHIHQPVAEGAHARAVDDAVVAAVSLHPTAVSRDHADQRSEAAARNHGHRRDDRTQQQPDQNVFARVWPSAVRSQSSLYIGASRVQGGAADYSAAQAQTRRLRSRRRAARHKPTLAAH